MGRGKTALQIGQECLNELRNRFLILTDEEYVDELSCYKVHDAVREMLIEIAREESFFSMHHRDKLSRRVIIYENMPQAIIENNNSSRLRTLLVVVDTETVPPILKANLHKFQRLRMLHLELASATNAVESVSFSKWLKGIGSLHHLVYLHLERVYALTALPDSIGNLSNLQWLAIINCCNLKSLPSCITRLEKLTVLRVVGCDSIECWPKGLGKLPNLVDLQVENSCISLSDLKQLKKLRRLFMQISHEEQVGEEECNVLEIPESLQLLRKHARLAKSCFPTQSSSSVEMLVLVELEDLEEDWANIERVMLFLKRAEVVNCPKLKYSEEAFQPRPYGGMTWKKYIKGN
ncbi:hypothetical protein ACLOJK_041857 [Asimina triloba]